MRLWSIHPKYLDKKGLLAVWREALLAQKVLSGQTKGYKNHPQLVRFKKTENPLFYLGAYLAEIAVEAKNRRYKFDNSKILFLKKLKKKITVTAGQVDYEWTHLKNKVLKRDLTHHEKLSGHLSIEVNPVFKIINGAIENWEKYAKK